MSFTYDAPTEQLRLSLEQMGTADITIPPGTFYQVLVCSPGGPSPDGINPGPGGNYIKEGLQNATPQPLVLRAIISDDTSSVVDAADGSVILANYGALPLTVSPRAAVDPGRPDYGDYERRFDQADDSVRIGPDGSAAFTVIGIGKGEDIDPDTGEPLGNADPGAIYVWLSTDEKVLRHSATYISVLRVAGKTDGLLCDIPVIDDDASSTGLPFTGAPSTVTGYIAYHLTIPWLDKASGGVYVTDEEPTGVQPFPQRLDQCVHQCASPPGYIILMYRPVFGATVILRAQGDLTLVKASVGLDMSTRTATNEYNMRADSGYDRDVFYRVVFQSTVPNDTLLAADRVDGQSSFENKLVTPLGEHAVWTGSGLQVTGQRKEVLTMLTTSNVLQRRDGVDAEPIQTASDVPRTPNLEFMADAPGVDDCNAFTFSMEQEYPLFAGSGDSRGVVVVDVVENDDESLSYTDPYGTFHVQDVFAGGVPLPAGARIVAAPRGNALGVSVLFTHDTTGEDVVLSTVDSVGPRQVRTGTGTDVWTLASALPLIVDAAGTIPPDEAGVVLYGSDIDRAAEGRPRLFAPWAPTPAASRTLYVPTMQPDVVSAGLRDPDDPTAVLRVYDAQYGRCVFVDRDTTLAFHMENTATFIAALTECVVDFGDGPVTLLQGSATPLFPGRVADFGELREGTNYRVQGSEGGAYMTRRGTTSCEHSPLGSRLAVFTVADAAPSSSTQMLVQSEWTLVQNAPRGMKYVQTHQVSAPVQGTGNYSPSTEPFPTVTEVSSGLPREAFADAAGDRFVRVGEPGSEVVQPVDYLTVVDGFVYDIFMDYPGPPPPSPGSETGGGDGGGEPQGPQGIECALLRVPTVRKYGSHASSFNMLGLVVQPAATLDDRLDFAGRRVRILRHAYNALAWMTSNPTATSGVDIVFARTRGCPDRLLSALRLLPQPVPEQAFEEARVCFGVDV